MAAGRGARWVAQRGGQTGCPTGPDGVPDEGQTGCQTGPDGVSNGGQTGGQTGLNGGPDGVPEGGQTGPDGSHVIGHVIFECHVTRLGWQGVILLPTLLSQR
jgi:hypothetical protein